MNNVSPSLARQSWFECVVDALRVERFAPAGYTIPPNIRVSVGFPKGSDQCKIVGQCWSPTASSDEHAELFISPILLDPVDIISTLGHEAGHATVGTGCGHRGPFKKCMLAIGLLPPMRSTPPSEDFKAWIADLISRIGPYPAGNLTVTKKQGTRLLKCQCAACGYLARVTQKWIVESGSPLCPTDKTPMEVAHG